MMVPESEMLAPVSRIRKAIQWITFLIAGAIVVVSSLIAHNFTHRITELASKMQQVQEGRYDLAYQPLGNDEIGELNNHFHYLTDELQMEKQYQYGRQAEAAELKALQAQINPHFLYNTLDLLTWEAREHDAPEMAELVQNLAKFYRLSLNQGKEMSTIGAELEHIRIYVSIENCHYDYAISLQIDCEEKYKAIPCIHILLQPFVENAIRHGMQETLIGNGLEILVRVLKTQDELQISIEDDGAGMDEETLRRVLAPSDEISPSGGYGIRNVQQRIRLLYGDAYGIRMESSPGEGTTVRIKIPLQDAVTI